MSSQNQNNLISRRDLLKLGAVATIGVCGGSLILPNTALASEALTIDQDYGYPLSRIEDPKIRSEWKSIVDECKFRNRDITLRHVTTNIEHVSPKRIGEVETINLTEMIQVYDYFPTFVFYCNYVAQLNSNGVKVFDEVKSVGVHPKFDTCSVEVNYSQYNFIDSRRTCQWLMAGVFGVKTEESYWAYINQALAVEFYAPDNSGHVYLP